MQPDPTFSQAFGHLSTAHGCRSLQIGGAWVSISSDRRREENLDHEFSIRSLKTAIRRKKIYFQILAGFTTFSGEPIIVIDEVGMKLDYLVELYVFLSFDSTFDRCLWKLKFEHGDLFIVQLDHDEQRAKMSEKKYNR